MYSTNSLLTSDAILLHVDEYQIFSFYLGKDFRIGKKYSSPFRKDKSPSFGIFLSKNGSLYFKDFATSEYGTVFDFVLKMHPGRTFMEVLAIINLDMNIGLLHNIKIETAIPVKGFNTDQSLQLLKDEGDTNYFDITLKVRKWEDIDVRYWGQFGLSVEVLTLFNVFPCAAVFLNGGASLYYPKNIETLTYAYAFYKDNEYSYKIYRPFNPKYKWLSNASSSVLQGWDQLPETHRVLIITKSLKDVMVLSTLGIPAVAVQGETQGVKPSIYKALQERFENIYVLFDFDLGGIIGTKMFKKINPECKYFFIQDLKTRRDGNKDISDYRKTHSPEECITHLRNSLLKWNPNL